MKVDLTPNEMETLSDGSWLGEIESSGNAWHKAQPVLGGIIDDAVDDGHEVHDSYRLFTTSLDPGCASAEELALVHAE